jgi:peptide/nickel transport system permease protein
LVFFCGGDYYHLFPAGGLHSSTPVQSGMLSQWADQAWHLVLPILCMSYSGVGYVARQVKTAAFECLQSDFILMARAKGLSRPAIFRRHVLPHAVLPAVTLLEFFFPALFAGSVLVESIFSIPGMGRLTVESVFSRDYPVLMGVGLFAAFSTLAGGLAIECLLRLWRGSSWEAA